MSSRMMEWRPGDAPLYADNPDGTQTLLLFTEEVAKRAEVAPSTIRWYNAAAASSRRRGAKAMFPAPDLHVRRTTLKADGNPVTVVTPMWREDKITTWLESRLGPGGRPRSELKMSKTG